MSAAPTSSSAVPAAVSAAPTSSSAPVPAAMPAAPLSSSALAWLRGHRCATATPARWDPRPAAVRASRHPTRDQAARLRAATNARRASVHPWRAGPRHRPRPSATAHASPRQPAMDRRPTVPPRRPAARDPLGRPASGAGPSRRAPSEPGPASPHRARARARRTGAGRRQTRRPCFPCPSAVECPWRVSPDGSDRLASVARGAVEFAGPAARWTARVATPASPRCAHHPSRVNSPSFQRPVPTIRLTRFRLTDARCSSP